MSNILAVRKRHSEASYLSIQQGSVVICDSAFITTSKVNRICCSFESVGDNSVPSPRKNEYRESAGGNNKLPEEFT